MMDSFLKWQEVEEAEFDLTPYVIEIGTVPPAWFWNALVRKDVVPCPKPKTGDLDWGGKGVRVVKTGQRFPLGSWITKGDLFSKSV